MTNDLIRIHREMELIDDMRKCITEAHREGPIPQNMLDILASFDERERTLQSELDGLASESRWIA